MNQHLPKRPAFEEFRELFLAQLNLVNGSNIQDPFYKWDEIGNRDIRLNILKSFYNKIEDLYGAELEPSENLADLDGVIESVVVQIYHAYSTMNIVERINVKIRAKMN